MIVILRFSCKTFTLFFFSKPCHLFLENILTLLSCVHRSCQVTGKQSSSWERDSSLGFSFPHNITATNHQVLPLHGNNSRKLYNSKSQLNFPQLHLNETVPRTFLHSSISPNGSTTGNQRVHRISVPVLHLQPLVLPPDYCTTMVSHHICSLGTSRYT